MVQYKIGGSVSPDKKVDEEFCPKYTKCKRFKNECGRKSYTRCKFWNKKERCEANVWVYGQPHLRNRGQTK